ncbi:lipase family protein [Streptomyces sp. DSM 44917]|uniref:Lipase family protein n=1 Tax=Streptomyces boetiae TaxID=3075541 RepID=A0ABU2L725_9ACTN|nr:lipase family protein [Streptomyces sp. DSM 44917]MDT0307370.1 lipase family protein [Streptomyces sp. DSM 44917]
MLISVNRLIACVLALAFGITLLAVSPWSASAGNPARDVRVMAEDPGEWSGDFYAPPSPLPEGEDGDVIRTEPVESGNAQVTRVMYLSRDAHGEPTAVTGLVVVPETRWDGPGERPVVAYAPGTAGVGDDCAPSKSYSDLLLRPLLDRGFAVVQTDYQGLGTPGDHTYVIREAQAHSVLDSLRAAQRLPGTGLAPDGPVGITGYSEGGNAAAAAAELAADYAPELDVRGVYAGAVPADLSVIAESLDGQYAVGFLGYALIGLNQAYPELDILGLANDRGREFFERARTVCAGEAMTAFAFTRTSSLTRDGRPVAEYTDEEPFASVMDQVRIGNIAPEVPVLVEHARNDDIVPYGQGRQMARDWCAAGAEQVEFRNIFSLIPLFSHVTAGLSAHFHSADWLADRFAGERAGSNCGRF